MIHSPVIPFDIIHTTDISFDIITWNNNIAKIACTRYGFCRNCVDFAAEVTSLHGIHPGPIDEVHRKI